MKKNKTQSRVKRNRKNRRKRIIKKIIQNVICLIVGLVYLIYLILKNINKLVIKLFNKLPKLIRIIIIYSLIGSSVLGINSLMNNKEVKTIVKEKIVTIEKVVQNENKEEEKQQEQEQPKEEVKAYNLTNENEKNIYNKGLELGLNEEQAILVVSISRHETGNWSSRYFNEYNNFGGVMCNTGIRKYNSYDEGLTHFVNLLKKYYFDLGLTTIEQIGAKYCPVGASNDPKGVNKNWVPGVTNIYNSYVNNAK